MSSFGALPEELQGCCADYLDIRSAGRFGQASLACRALADEQLVKLKAARERAVLEKVSSRWCEALAATCRVADGPNLVTFADGWAKMFKCTCSPDKEFKVGGAVSNLARHLGTRQHWNQWRLAAHGEAQPTEAAWLAFAASLPGALAPRRRV
jgi:hypothetical protein